MSCKSKCFRDCGNGNVVFDELCELGWHVLVGTKLGETMVKPSQAPEVEGRGIYVQVLIGNELLTNISNLSLPSSSTHPLPKSSLILTVQFQFIRGFHSKESGAKLYFPLIKGSSLTMIDLI